MFLPLSFLVGEEKKTMTRNGNFYGFLGGFCFCFVFPEGEQMRFAVETILQSSIFFPSFQLDFSSFFLIFKTRHFHLSPPIGFISVYGWKQDGGAFSLGQRQRLPLLLDLSLFFSFSIPDILLPVSSCSF